MKYDYHVSQNRKKKYLKRLYIFLMVVFLIVIIVGIAIKIESMLNNDRNTTDATTSAVTTSYFAPSTQIFRTPYFQFQANKTWAEVPSESSANKFVYRSLRSNLIEHELTIYTDAPPANIGATHVMPVKKSNNNTELIPGTVSKHCREGNNMTASDQMVKVSGIEMLCDVDNTQYKVVVGEKGSGTVITLTRPNKSKQNYAIYYSNVTARPEASQLIEILSSFQTR